ncbi:MULTISPECIES: ribosome maturation factor RimM [unclassified Paenibacillus]|uniref:ribosome maturation factor RimM n=1 Tax=unclassified Paenibacillus TaxID=185978 RepID=UPI00031F273B|nr:MULTISPECIES: ribosome maturation factor RimM [unclassified Paenibacillus]MCM3337276.1 ribosome maturation factor RimM [Paenibacillus sp. MER TA 81-3]
MAEKLYNVGKVVNTHGIRGEVKVFPQTDFPDVRFAQGSELILQHPETQSTLSVTVERSRLHKNMYIVKLKQFDDINDVEKYKGWMLKVSEAQLVELPEDEYYYHEIIGCRVVSDEGEELGVIDEILAPGANDVWVVKPSKGKPILIPVIDDVLLNVDIEGKVVTVHLMEGLI